VTRVRSAMLLLAVGLALLCFTTPAWAHPGHEAPVASNGLHAPGQPDTAPEGREVARAREALRRHAPTSVALVVAALSLLAAMPRRRALALALMLPLSIASLEGVLHAALHLHHARHADGLAIGASPAQPAAADPDTDGPPATPALLLGEVVEAYNAPVPGLVVSPSRGRAPPTSPA